MQGQAGGSGRAAGEEDMGRMGEWGCGRGMPRPYRIEEDEDEIGFSLTRIWGFH